MTAEFCAPTRRLVHHPSSHDLEVPATFVIDGDQHQCLTCRFLYVESTLNSYGGLT